MVAMAIASFVSAWRAQCDPDGVGDSALASYRPAGSSRSTAKAAISCRPAGRRGRRFPGIGSSAGRFDRDRQPLAHAGQRGMGESSWGKRRRHLDRGPGPVGRSIRSAGPAEVGRPGLGRGGADRQRRADPEHRAIRHGNRLGHSRHSRHHFLAHRRHQCTQSSGWHGRDGDRHRANSQPGNLRFGALDRPRGGGHRGIGICGGLARLLAFQSLAGEDLSGRRGQHADRDRCRVSFVFAPRSRGRAPCCWPLRWR